MDIKSNAFTGIRKRENMVYTNYFQFSEALNVIKTKADNLNNPKVNHRNKNHEVSLT